MVKALKSGDVRDLPTAPSWVTSPPDPGSNDEQVLRSARRTLKVEIDGLHEVLARLDQQFVLAIDLMAACSGRIIITGMGKSGLICRKIAATLASTGTPAQFLHPAEAIHGDLGIVTPRDLLIAVSYSGETEEVLRLLPVIKRFAVPMIAVTGRARSSLAQAAQVHLDAGVTREACPLGLAPTASTTATLALGDALAVALLERKGFSEKDFAVFHPGGSLGRRLLIRVADLMHTGEEMPLVPADRLVLDALYEISSKRMGVTGVIDGSGALQGVFTDGDLRRLIARSVDELRRPIGEVMSAGGYRIKSTEMAAVAVAQMQAVSVTSLFVIDVPVAGAAAVPVGIIHMHDLLNAGVV